MSLTYHPVHWNRQKKLYDSVLATILLAGIATHIAVSSILNPNLTIETLLIRGFALSAILLLHAILCIGPLARLNPRFLPLLYNRRHLGVTMFFFALAHAALAVFQFHALGDENPIVSVFTAYARDYQILAEGTAVSQFPFEPFGLGALLILFLMVATSHDFWLRNLGASFWKHMHMGVYLAYGLLLAHVAYGALQSERNPLYVGLLAAGFLLVATLHTLAYRKEARTDRMKSTSPEDDGYVKTCAVDKLREGRGKVVVVNGTRLAVFRYGDRVHAFSNVCRHQGGPIGDGRVVDGCVTCPWHGWQYKPEDGASPPPFKEVISTYKTRLFDGHVYIHPEPNPLGSACPGSEIIHVYTCEEANHACDSGS
jgi:nitrite reductase/ring-hydroxylating ferredoxin subunit/DMSO/TMAO reductase YedYZ heme-binding membrane subunit